MYSELKNQMKEFYLESSHNDEKTYYANTSALDIRKKIYDEMDEYYKQEKNQYLLKSHIHTLIAENFKPQIFTHSPFFFEMGLRERRSWGMSKLSPSTWVIDRVGADINEKHPINVLITDIFGPYLNEQESGICSINKSFDNDHHSLGYTMLFSEGIGGIKRRAEFALQQETDSDKICYYKAIIESCVALIKIAKRFSEKAKELLECEYGEEEKRFLKMIEDVSERIPEQSPKTFYEGLAMIVFTREVVATMEGIGISQLGHMDRLLIDLYENDISSGRLTEESAKDLLKRWMLYTDIKFDLENNEWPETSTCVQLGGCDENGEVVYNDVTRIIIESHHELGLVNPKLNCRYSSESPREYIELIGKAILSGHNNFTLINDDIIISGLVKSGVELKDARRYVSGGCQETMIEGCGHTEGAAVYFCMPRLLDLYLRPDSKYGLVESVGSPIMS